jgi:predicted nucleotidyltransferase
LQGLGAEDKASVCACSRYVNKEFPERSRICGVAQGSTEIAWPSDMQVTMSVAGYPEVLQASELVALESGCIVKVASLAGLAILKLIAWSERGSTNPKDAHDLYQIITQYA